MQQQGCPLEELIADLQVRVVARHKAAHEHRHATAQTFSAAKHLLGKDKQRFSVINLGMSADAELAAQVAALQEEALARSPVESEDESDGDVNSADELSEASFGSMGHLSPAPAGGLPTSMSLPESAIRLVQLGGPGPTEDAHPHSSVIPSTAFHDTSKAPLKPKNTKHTVFDRDGFVRPTAPSSPARPVPRNADGSYTVSLPKDWLGLPQTAEHGTPRTSIDLTESEEQHIKRLGFESASTFTPPDRSSNESSPVSGSNSIPLRRKPKLSSHWPRHEHFLSEGRLFDPRLRHWECTFEQHPEDDMDRTIGLHRLPPAVEVQRKVLWSFVRLSIPPSHLQIGIRTLLGLRKAAAHEWQRTEHMLAIAGSSLNHLYDEISRVQRDHSDLTVPSILDTEFGAEAFETYMQLCHSSAVTRLIWVCMEIDKLCYEQVHRGKMEHVCGHQFYWVLLKRMMNMEYYTIKTAKETAERIRDFAIEARYEDDPGTAISLYTRAIAYLLPFFPSRWLMEPEEAQENGLSDVYTAVLTELMDNLLLWELPHVSDPVFLPQLVAELYYVIQRISGLTPAAHAENVESESFLRVAQRRCQLTE